MADFLTTRQSVNHSHLIPTIMSHERCLRPWTCHRVEGLSPAYLLHSQMPIFHDAMMDDCLPKNESWMNVQRCYNGLGETQLGRYEDAGLSRDGSGVGGLLWSE